MAGMTDLHEILGALRPYVRQGAYVYVTAQNPPEVAYHDHLLVPLDSVGEAMDVLGGLSS